MSSPTPSAEPTIRFATEEGPLPPHFPHTSPPRSIKLSTPPLIPLSPPLTPSTDVPTILALIHELAAYEHASSSVHATPASLLATLTFPSAPSAGYAKTLLIFPPSPASPTPQTSPSPASNPPTSPSPASPPCAGLALFFTNYSTWRAAPGIYLEDLFVQPAWRGRGYGTALLRALARETRRIGGQRLEWSVLRWNEPSLKFYDGLGAVRMEEWVGMRVEGEGLGRLAGDGEGEDGREGGRVEGGSS
ncbi:hypothetical protein MMC13_006770 [Lambiella insularis]|nr:hypothetical protein [Lambiella insularis]